jgi:hypothetical protein
MTSTSTGFKGAVPGLPVSTVLSANPMFMGQVWQVSQFVQ